MLIFTTDSRKAIPKPYKHLQRFLATTSNANNYNKLKTQLNA